MVTPYFQPCHAAAWEVHIQFKVHGSGKALFGDGFAIWYTKERMKPGENNYFSFH